MSHLKDRVLIVTGAGSGFGRLTSEMAAARGASVVAADIDEAAANETVARVVEKGGNAVAVRADVASKADMDRVAALAMECFGAIDVLLNNAGVMPLAFFEDHEQAWQAWDRCVDINIKGVVNGITAVYDQMVAQGRGHIVNISSIYGNRGTAGSGVYSATKAAVAVLSDALRMEAQGKIKVTVVRPTGVPGTNLGSGVVNPMAIVGIAGHNVVQFGERLQTWMSGGLPTEQSDPDDVRYWTLSPEDLAAQIISVIDMPWGVTIGDITVRATGEDYIN